MEELSYLFFIDDMLLSYKPSKRALLICILSSFQTVSGLNNNLALSKLVRLGDGRDASNPARTLRCKRVELLIKYLELPLGAK